MKHQRKQNGVYTIEFVLVVGILFLFFLSIVELGKILYYFNASTQATREAARLGAVCSMQTSKVISKVTGTLPFSSSANVIVKYEPNGCNVESCKTITVSLSGAKYKSSIFGTTLDIPNFSTTLPRESLDSQYNANCS